MPICSKNKVFWRLSLKTRLKDWVSCAVYRTSNCLDKSLILYSSLELRSLGVLHSASLRTLGKTSSGILPSWLCFYHSVKVLWTLCCLSVCLAVPVSLSVFNSFFRNRSVYWKTDEGQFLGEIRFCYLGQ